MNDVDTNIDLNCNDEECTPSSLQDQSVNNQAEHANTELIYVGDPMCSWCWGISPELKKLKEHYSNYKFRIVVGGLRPGGGDPWNEEMKNFLQHHWQQVNARSGQPFSYDLFDKEEFNYDTEPPCRAVVIARQWLEDNELAFFEAIHYKFYAQSEDPNDVEFYRSICEQFGIDYESFKIVFESELSKKVTQEEFMLNRQWGVRGYPTVLLLKNDQLFAVTNGYASFEEMRTRIDALFTQENMLS